MKFLRKYVPYYGLIIVIIFSIWAIKPLFNPGFFPTHDDTQPTRIFEMAKALRDGLFPVRWVNDLGYGYGYPIFNFYAPLAYYAGALFMSLGMHALLATKFTFGVGIILAGITMYFLGKSLWGEIGGIVSGIFYQYALYHAVDIYVRGDLAEFWAYALTPLAFYGLYKVFIHIKERKKRWYALSLGALGLAGVFLSHNLSAVIVMLYVIPFCIVLIICSGLHDKTKTAWYLFLTILFAILLSSFYIFPVPFEMKFTNVLSQVGGTSDYHNHFVCLSQFWYSPWGYGGSVPGCIDGLSFMLGKLSLFFSLLGILCSVMLWKKRKYEAIILLGAGFGWVTSLWLTTASSEFIWHIIPFLSFLQYPWRFLMMTSFFCAILSGGVLHTVSLYLKKSIILFSLVLVICVLLILLQGKYFTPQYYKKITSADYTNTDVIRWKISKISDEYLPKNFLKPKSNALVIPYPFLIFPPAGVTLSEKDTTGEKQARIKGFEDAYLVLGLAYFPAWHYYIDEKPAIIQNHSGKVLIQVPKGTHILTLKFQQTPIEIIGNVLSLTGLLGILLGIMLFREKKKLHEKAYR